MRSADWPNCRARGGARGALLLTTALLAAASSPVAAQRTSYEELQTFSAVLNQIRLAYVDSVGQSELVRSAIAGALNVLDPHSVYLRAGVLDRLTAARSGLAGSIGARLEHDGSGVVVLAVGTGSPAARAGVHPGDRLLAVNDTPVVGLSAHEAEALLAGDVGSSLRLRLDRGAATAQASATVKLKRDRYRWPAVAAPLRLDSVTGYVRLEQFSEGAAEELEKAIDRLRDAGASRLILDLRGNPGGLVAEAQAIAGLFLPKDAVVARAIGRGGKVAELRSRGGGLGELPLLVLVDQGSASAAELLAAALQDYDRARIVGRRSFGKALMQQHIPLAGGDVLALTTARIESPVGRSLQRDYRGLERAQYFAMAGDSTAVAVDSARSFGGRPLGPGPGVAPDLPLPLPDRPPSWWTDVLEAGLDLAVADAAAAALTDSEAAWAMQPERWRTLLAAPLLERARERLGAGLQASAGELHAVGRRLAARVALVRWGQEAADRFLATTDPDISAARTAFD